MARTPTRRELICQVESCQHPIAEHKPGGKCFGIIRKPDGAIVYCICRNAVPYPDPA